MPLQARSLPLRIILSACSRPDVKRGFQLYARNAMFYARNATYARTRPMAWLEFVTCYGLRQIHSLLRHMRQHKSKKYEKIQVYNTNTKKQRTTKIDSKRTLQQYRPTQKEMNLLICKLSTSNLIVSTLTKLVQRAL